LVRQGVAWLSGVEVMRDQMRSERPKLGAKAGRDSDVFRGVPGAGVMRSQMVYPRVSSSSADLLIQWPRIPPAFDAQKGISKLLSKLPRSTTRQAYFGSLRDEYARQQRQKN
jgi:hypothetical protein